MDDDKVTPLCMDDKFRKNYHALCILITTALYRCIGALLLPREYICIVLEFCFLALHNFPCFHVYTCLSNVMVSSLHFHLNAHSMEM